MQVISRRLRLEGNFDFRYVAKRTPGFVGADLAALTKEAAAVAVTRIFRQLDAAAAATGAEAAMGSGDSGGAEGAPTQSGAAGASGVDGMLVDGGAEDGSRGANLGVGSGGGEDAGAVSVPTAWGNVAAAAAVVAQRLGCGPLTAVELRGLAITMSDFEAALPKVGFMLSVRSLRHPELRSRTKTAV